VPVVKSADQLKAEIKSLREFALSVTDPDVLEAIETLIEELEGRLLRLEGG